MQNKIDLYHTTLPNPPIIKTDLSKYIVDINRYIDSNVFNDLFASLSGWLKIPEDSILIGSGTSELIELTSLWAPEGMIFICAPTFHYYENSLKKFNREYVLLNWIWEGEKLRIPEKVYKEASLIYIVNPNNPTGHYVPSSEIQHLLDSTKAVIVIDESFIEYSNNSLINLAVETGRIIILRTFSKAFGLGGIRTGYLISNKIIVEEFNQLKNPLTTNRLAVVLAQECITKYLNEYKSTWESYLHSLDILKSILQSKLYTIYSGKCNFICLRFNNKSMAEFFNQLCQEENLHVREGWCGEFSGDCNNLVRITLPPINLQEEVFRRFERIKSKLEQSTD